MHDKRVPSRLRRSLELHLERLHVVCRFPRVVVEGFVKGDQRKGRDGDFAEPAVGEENVPSRGSIAGEVRSVGEGRLEWLFLRGRFGGCAFEDFRIFLIRLGGFAAEQGVEVAFVWIYVFEVEFVDWGNVGAAGGDDAGFNNELDEGAGGDEALAHDFEKGLFDI